MDEVNGNVYLRTSIIGSGVDQYVVSTLLVPDNGEYPHIFLFFSTETYIVGTH